MDILPWQQKETTMCDLWNSEWLIQDTNNFSTSNLKNFSHDGSNCEKIIIFFSHWRSLKSTKVNLSRDHQLSGKNKWIQGRIYENLFIQDIHIIHRSVDLQIIL